MNDFVIVGAGVCGLELGAMLAHDRYQVVVLEKQNRYAGRAFLWEKDGFIVDNGIHLIRFGPKSATAEVFRHLGEKLGFIDLGTSRLLDEDGQVKDFPTNPTGFLTTRLMTARERLHALGLIVKMGRQNPMDLLGTSVADWMDRMGISGGLYRYLTLVSASMQVCPFIDRASAGELILNVKSVIKKGKSVMYPAQGWKGIYDTLVRTIQRHGEIRTGAKVDRLEVRNGRACGVHVGGEQIEARNIVLNLPCQEIFTLVDASLVDPAFVKQCQTQRPTSGVVLDYGLTRRICEDTGLWYMWEPMSFGMFTSNLYRQAAPPDKQLLTWFYPTLLEDMADREKAGQRTEALESALFRLFPELETAIEWRRAQHLRMVDGVEINVDQHRLLRPGYSVPGIRNLYLVGDSLRAAGAGGDVGHESVLGCYREIIGRTQRTGVSTPS